MPRELQKLEDLLVLHDREIRRLKAWKAQIAAGDSVRATKIIGVVGPPSGGTGVSGSILGAVSMWENQSGASRSQGAVVVYNGDRTFGVTTTPDDPDAIGVLDDDAVAVGEDGRVRHVGYQAVVDVQGAVVAGNYLRTSATAGRAEDAGASPTVGTFAVALTAFAGPGAGQVAAYVNAGLGGGGGGMAQHANEYHDPDMALASDLSTHAGAADPHTGYIKETEKDAASGVAGLTAATKLNLAQMQEVMAYADLTDDPVGTHAGAADPHTGYQKESEKGAASGYAGLTSETFGEMLGVLLTETSTPANPVQNKLKFFSRAVGASIELVARSSQGQEAILATLLDGAAAPAKKFLLLGVKQ